MLIAGKPGEFHDEAIQALIRERARKYHQTYITNDLANAWDVYNSIYNSQSVDRNLKKLLIYRVTNDGKLVTHNQLQHLSALNKNELKAFFNLWSKEKKYKEAEEFLAEKSDFMPLWAKRNEKQKIQFENLSNNTGAKEAKNNNQKFIEPAIKPIVNLDYDVPKAGSTLRAIYGDNVSNITLDEKIARGGEGIIYTISTESGKAEEYLAKVYKKTKLAKNIDHATQIKNKVNYIVGSGFNNRIVKKSKSKLGDKVKFPSHVLINEDNEFVGYLMKKAKGMQLSRFIADGAIESEFKRTYPDVTRLDLVDICINFLKVMESLHSQNILVGDLNTNNILVNLSTNEVYLIDADSYQYANKFPCNVGVEKYTAPEFLKCHTTNYRTKQNELFVVARVLCEILMMVDNLYNSRIAQEPILDMKNGKFRYTFEFMKTTARGMVRG